MKHDLKLERNDPERGGANREVKLSFAVRRLALWAVVVLPLLCTPNLKAQAYNSTNFWTGLGGDSYWPTPGNWSNNLVPLDGALVVLTNYGSTGLPGVDGVGLVGTPNIVVSNNTSLGALWISNTNLAGANAGFHTIEISNGVTLTISNNATFTGQNVTNIIQVCSQAGYTGQFGVDNGVNARLYGTIQGEGGTLAVICTNGVSGYERGNIFISQGSAGLSAAPIIDPVNSILDMSGLGTFDAQLNRICVAADSGRTPFFFHRAAGTLYLAKTNNIRLLAVGNHPSGAAVTQGILAGIIAQNNGGGYVRIGKVVLGHTNAIFCNTGMGIGIRNSSGWLGFNPYNPPGTSVAYFRNLAGTGRQSMWAVGNRLGITASGTAISGELDFSNGTIDAMVDQLQIGKSASALVTVGTVSFGSGTLDCNTLQLGYQTSSGNAAGQGTLNISNNAVLKVNTSGALGHITANPVAGQSYFGVMNITDGGTVEFANTAPITCGAGNASAINVIGGSLKVFTIGAPATPLQTLQLAGSTLTVDRGILSNPTVAPIVVDWLNTSLTNTVNLYGKVLVVGRFPLIKYNLWIGGDFSNFQMGMTSPGVTAHLENNPSASTIDVVVTSSTTATMVWNGKVNGVDNGDWDINTTPSWQNAATYLQDEIPGSLVRFDDTAAGTTTVNLVAPNLAPADILVTNNAKAYTFSGSGGMAGPGALTKSGSGTLLVANTGLNSFSGGVVIEGGTVRLGEAANRLPTNSIVTFANAAANLDLNNLDQTLNALSGGGTTGGNINLGSATLTIRSGGASYGGSISGSGALVKNGGGTQVFTSGNTYAGGTTISNSTLRAANTAGSALGTGPVVIGAGGVLQLGDGDVDGNIDAQYITNNGSLLLFPATSYTLTKNIVGTGSLTKLLNSSATITVTNANAYTGGTAIQEGIMHISQPDALGSGTITVGGATANPTELDLANDITLTNSIVLSGKTGAIIPSPVSINSVLDMTTGLASTNTIAGNLTINGSTCWAVGADAGKLILTGGFANAQAGALCELFLRGSAEGLWAKPLRDNNASLKLMLTKSDSGTWLVSSTNTFTGRTAVNAGTFMLDGALNGTSYVMVYSDATFGGKGFITGPVTNSGALFPGGADSLGTLTISNVLYLDVTSTTTVDVSPAGNDQVRGLTSVIYGGTLKVTLAAPLTGNCIFRLFDATNYAGSFGVLDLPDISPLTWDFSKLEVDGTLRAVGGPAVTPAITGVSYSGAAGFSISGTGALVAPFDVLTSTNVADPLSAWIKIGSGTLSNGTFLFQDSGATNAPQRFYRVTTPGF